MAATADASPGSGSLHNLLLLAAILAAYLALGGAYALNTPLWQAPDEPAHFNYVRDVAEGKGLPVLQSGDYDADYMERIKRAHFPSDMSVDRIRYESHQPPLYYSLQALVYQGAAGRPVAEQVLLLRLFSLLLGTVFLCTVYRAGRIVFATDSHLALGVTALVAFIPQHLHISASVENDVLGELLLTGILLALLVRLRASGNPYGLRAAVPLGLLLGLALLAKTTSYIAVPLIPLGLTLAGTARGDFRWTRVALSSAVVYAVALVVSGWWFLRNVLTYGGLDVFGLGRHDQIVVGQPRVGVFDWEAAGRFAGVGFRSFWAQFGWMGVPSDSRTYAFVSVLSALAVAGLVVFVVRQLRRRSLTSFQTASLALLLAAFLLVLAGVVTYNLEFIQPQGRYLFPALLPVGVFTILGLREFMGRRTAAPVTLLSVLLFILAAYNLWQVLIPGLR